MALLSDYETQVADLLKDPLNQYWSLTQLDSYINEARKQTVQDTGCLRTLQLTACSLGDESYTFGQVTGITVTQGGSGYSTPTIAFSGGGGSGVAATLNVTNGAVTSVTVTNPGSGYTSAPSYVISGAGSGAQLSVGIVSALTYDILGINLYWGGLRYPLEWRPWSMFSALMRGWTTYQRQPAMWAVYGNNTFFLGPVPDQSYMMELDSVLFPPDYAVGDYATIDVIPVLNQAAIKFYAAYLAKFNSQSFGEAEIFRKQYDKKIQEAVGAYTRRIPDVYQAGYERR